MPNPEHQRSVWAWLCLSLLLGQWLTGCQTTAATPPAIKLIPFESRVQEITFQSSDGVQLAGQIDWPLDPTPSPLVFIIHHSGPVDRDSYQYLAARLVPAGYAVFRFDKRGNGRSGGVYGCCEADDALAAYRAVIEAGGFDPGRVFIIAQSIGSKILADRFAKFSQIHRPAGVLLLSNLLKNEEIQVIKGPLHIIVSDSEPKLVQIGPGAVQAYQAKYGGGVSLYIAPRTEHTLFDISSGPIDWADPNWPDRFPDHVWLNLLDWLEQQITKKPEAK